MTLERMITLRWAVLTRLCPEDIYGNRANPEKFKKGLIAFENAVTERAVATVKDRDGETCFVVTIDEGIYLDDREWLSLTYIKPSHGFTPDDWYCGSWLPVGITLK